MVYESNPCRTDYPTPPHMPPACEPRACRPCPVVPPACEPRACRPCSVVPPAKMPVPRPGLPECLRYKHPEPRPSRLRPDPRVLPPLCTPPCRAPLPGQTTCYTNQCQPKCRPVYRYENGLLIRRLPLSAYKRNGIQDHVYGVGGSINYLCECSPWCMRCD